MHLAVGFYHERGGRSARKDHVAQNGRLFSRSQPCIWLHRFMSSTALLPLIHVDFRIQR